MIVVDASVAVKWFVTEAGHQDAVALLDGDLALIAPDFVVLEVLNVLSRKLRRGEIVAEQLAAAISALPTFFDEFVPAHLLIKSTARLSETLQHSIYDCSYLACAIENGAILVTADKKFAERAERGGYRSSIRCLGESGTRQSSEHPDRALVLRAVALHDANQRTFDFVRQSVAGSRATQSPHFLPLADLQPAFNSLSNARLYRFVLGLSREQRIHLLAVGWIGQNTSGQDWVSIQVRANAYLTDERTEQISYLVSLFGYLEEGQNRLDLRATESGPTG